MFPKHPQKLRVYLPCIPGSTPATLAVLQNAGFPLDRCSKFAKSLRHYLLSVLALFHSVCYVTPFQLNQAKDFFILTLLCVEDNHIANWFVIFDAQETAKF